MNAQNITRENAKTKGYPTFNDCPHHFFDLKESQLGTFRVSLSNDSVLTIRVIEDMDEEGRTGGKVTFSYETSEGKANLEAIAFKDGRSQNSEGHIYGLYYGRFFQTLEDDYPSPVYELDWSEIKEIQTLSIRLDNGTGLTCCVIPYFQANGGKSGSIDVKIHGKHQEGTELKTGMTIIQGDMYAIVYDSVVPVEA